MRIELLISLRYFRSRQTGGSMTFISRVAAGGVALGVAALLVAMSVMNGYKANLTRAMSGALPHVSMHALEGTAMPREAELEALFGDGPRPTTISPYVRHETLLGGPHPDRGSVRGVMLRAIETSVESGVPDLLAFLSDGDPDWKHLPLATRLKRARALLLRLREAPAPGVAPVLLSPMLAQRLGVELGEELMPMEFPRQGAGFSPSPLPTRLRLIGYFQSGIASVDEFFVLMDVNRIRDIFPRANLQTSLGLRLADPLQASKLAAEMRERIKQSDKFIYVFSWLEDNQGLFGMIQLQSWMLFFVLLLIVILALFGMISGLVMMVAEKTREITILKSLGVPNRSIHRIFVVQGYLIALAGTALGLGIGLGACWALDTFPLFTIPPGVYPGSDRVPVLVNWMDLLLVVGATMAACLAATYIPARKAAALHPADGLRAA